VHAPSAGRDGFGDQRERRVAVHLGHRDDERRRHERHGRARISAPWAPSPAAGSERASEERPWRVAAAPGRRWRREVLGGQEQPRVAGHLRVVLEVEDGHAEPAAEQHWHNVLADRSSSSWSSVTLPQSVRDVRCRRGKRDVRPDDVHALHEREGDEEERWGMDWIDVEGGADAIDGEARATLRRRVVVVRAALTQLAVRRAANWEARDLARDAGSSVRGGDGGLGRLCCRKSTKLPLIIIN